MTDAPLRWAIGLMSGTSLDGLPLSLPGTTGVPRPVTGGPSAQGGLGAA